jgi:hypothetical protein
MVWRDARREMLDQQGIEASIIIPSKLTELHATLPLVPSDIPAMRANFSSFNLWLEEEWGFGADGRHFAAPVVDLSDPDWATEEALRVAELGRSSST